MQYRSAKNRIPEGLEELCPVDRRRSFFPVHVTEFMG
jgi:hypothetical protein